MTLPHAWHRFWRRRKFDLFRWLLGRPQGDEVLAVIWWHDESQPHLILGHAPLVIEMSLGEFGRRTPYRVDR